MMSKIRILISITIFFITLSLGINFTGCDNANQGYESLIPLSNISLVEIWNIFLTKTKINEQSATLESFNLQATKLSELESLYFTFNAIDENGKTMFYYVSFNTNGDISWYSCNADRIIIPTNPPFTLFQALDYIDLTSIEPGDSGFSISIDIESGNVGYKDEYIDVYVLRSGELHKIKEIIFDSNQPWATIWVRKTFTSNTHIYDDTPNPITEIASQNPVKENQCAVQVWFLEADLVKASSINYLEPN